MTVIPTKIIHDSLGNRKLVPDHDNAVTLMVNASTDRQSTAELIGQVDVEVVKIHVRSAPAGSWSQVLFRGKVWDLAKPPTTTELSRALRHVELTLRSRNQNIEHADD